MVPTATTAVPEVVAAHPSPNSSTCLNWRAGRAGSPPCRDWSVCSGIVAPRMGRGLGAACVAPSGAAGGDGSGSERVRQVLLVHEQHPQPLGCDRRLLSLVRLLQDQGKVRVSLLYRRDVPPHEQAPRTPELAASLGIEPFDMAQLDGCIRPPPALW